MRIPIIAIVVLCCRLAAVAQDDVISRARAAAADGRLDEAIAALERHLAADPRDTDARLLYGLALSWSGDYDAARAALGEVLAQVPEYLDARVALMNVEWWSGRLDAARDLNRAVLARDPGNAQARLVQQRLDARLRPWSVGASYTNDIFSDDREVWHETSMMVGREAPVGSIILRASHATRFGVNDRQVDVEFYPVFRAGTYAFVGAGIGADEALYPGHRLSFELYQSLGHGVEVSGGFRRLAFANAATIYLGTVSKYAGNWMVTGKAQAAPDDRLGAAWSYHASARRYFGGAGTSYVGLGYSRGFTREEPRGAGDLVRLDADTVRGQADIEVRDRVRLMLQLSTGRQQRAVGAPLWQTTIGGGTIVRF